MNKRLRIFLMMAVAFTIGWTLADSANSAGNPAYWIRLFVLVLLYFFLTIDYYRNNPKSKQEVKNNEVQNIHRE